MSNNKQSMKLYTEEELRKHLYNHSDEFFEQLTPIELPSDEGIKKIMELDECQSLMNLTLIIIFRWQKMDA
jgi:hypothetical protein